MPRKNICRAPQQGVFIGHSQGKKIKSAKKYTSFGEQALKDGRPPFTPAKNLGLDYQALKPIRKNPKYKEIKMEEPKTSKETASNEGQETSSVTERQRYKCVSVNINEADNHYLASFNHGPRRVFHNMQELLVAIEVEVNKLTAKLKDG